MPNHYDTCRPGYCSGCGQGPGAVSGGRCTYCGGYANVVRLSPLPTRAERSFRPENYPVSGRGRIPCAGCRWPNTCSMTLERCAMLSWPRS